jgi:hypothetical protein
MKVFFDVWLRDYPDPYPKNRHYRKQIKYAWVKENGALLMTIKNGEVVSPELDIEAPEVVIEPELAIEPSPDV